MPRITTYKKYKEHIIIEGLTNPKYKHKTFRKVDERYYYVYRVTNLETGLHYYGSRVSNIIPEKDLGINYFTSSSYIYEDFKRNPSKFKAKIIKVFDNKDDRYCYESFLHQYFNVGNNPHFMNKANQTPFGFAPGGFTAVINLETKNKEVIDCKIYQENKDKYQSVNSGYMTVYNKITNEWEYINIDKYYTNKQNYIKTTEQMSEKRKITMGIPSDKFNGLTPQQIAVINSNRTKNQIEENGYTRAQNQGKRHSKTMSSKSDEEWDIILSKRDKTARSRDYDGLNSYQYCAKNGNETKRNTIHENGMNTLELQAMKRKQTIRNFSPERKAEINKKTLNTMNSIQENGKTIKEICTENMLKTNLKKGRIHHVQIFDNNDNLRFDCPGNFMKVCKENNLPMDKLHECYKKNIKINYKKPNMMISRGKGHFLKFIGWYAKKIN